MSERAVWASAAMPTPPPQHDTATPARDGCQTEPVCAPRSLPRAKRAQRGVSASGRPLHPPPTPLNTAPSRLHDGCQSGPAGRTRALPRANGGLAALRNATRADIVKLQGI